MKKYLNFRSSTAADDHGKHHPVNLEGLGELWAEAAQGQRDFLISHSDVADLRKAYENLFPRGADKEAIRRALGSSLDEAAEFIEVLCRYLIRNISKEDDELVLQLFTGMEDARSLNTQFVLSKFLLSLHSVDDLAPVCGVGVPSMLVKLLSRMQTVTVLLESGQHEEMKLTAEDLNVALNMIVRALRHIFSSLTIHQEGVAKLQGVQIAVEDLVRGDAIRSLIHMTGQAVKPYRAGFSRWVEVHAVDILLTVLWNGMCRELVQHIQRNMLLQTVVDALNSALSQESLPNLLGVIGLFKVLLQSSVSAHMIGEYGFVEHVLSFQPLSLLKEFIIKLCLQIYVKGKFLDEMGSECAARVSRIPKLDFNVEWKDAGHESSNSHEDVRIYKARRLVFEACGSLYKITALRVLEACDWNLEISADLVRKALFAHTLAYIGAGDTNLDYSGVGIGITQQAKSDDSKFFFVSRIVEGGPAQKHGDLKVGDIIVSVDEEPISELDLEGAMSKLRGPSGTHVKLKVLSPESPAQPKVLTICREVIQDRERRPSTSAHEDITDSFEKEQAAKVLEKLNSAVNVETAREMLEQSIWNVDCAVARCSVMPQVQAINHLMDITKEFAFVGQSSSVLVTESYALGQKDEGLKSDHSIPRAFNGKTNVISDSKSDAELASVPGRKVCNPRVFDMFADLWQVIPEDAFRMQILDMAFVIFAEHPLNFFAVQDSSLLTFAMESMNILKHSLKDRVMKVLEYVLTIDNVLPLQHLCLLTRHMDVTWRQGTANFALGKILKWMQYDERLADILRETGFLHVVLNHLKSFRMLVSPKILPLSEMRNEDLPLNKWLVNDNGSLLTVDYAISNISGNNKFFAAINHNKLSSRRVKFSIIVKRASVSKFCFPTCGVGIASKGFLQTSTFVTSETAFACFYNDKGQLENCSAKSSDLVPFMWNGNTCEILISYDPVTMCLSFSQNGVKTVKFEGINGSELYPAVYSCLPGLSFAIQYVNAEKVESAGFKIPMERFQWQGYASSTKGYFRMILNHAGLFSNDQNQISYSNMVNCISKHVDFQNVNEELSGMSPDEIEVLADRIWQAIDQNNVLNLVPVVWTAPFDLFVELVFEVARGGTANMEIVEPTEVGQAALDVLRYFIQQIDDISIRSQSNGNLMQQSNSDAGPKDDPVLHSVLNQLNIQDVSDAIPEQYESGDYQSSFVVPSTFEMAVEVLITIVTGNKESVASARDEGIIRTCLDLISFDSWRPGALRILSRFVLEDEHLMENDLQGLLEVVNESTYDKWSLRYDVFKAMVKLAYLHPRIASELRNGWIRKAVEVLQDVGKIDSTGSTVQKLALSEVLFKFLSYSMYFCSSVRDELWDRIGCFAFVDALRKSRLLEIGKGLTIIGLLLGIATERISSFEKYNDTSWDTIDLKLKFSAGSNFDENTDIAYFLNRWGDYSSSSVENGNRSSYQDGRKVRLVSFADAAVLALAAVQLVHRDCKTQAAKAILLLARVSARNKRTFSNARMLFVLSTVYKDVLFDVQNNGAGLHQIFNDLVISLCRHRLSLYDARSLFRFLSPDTDGNYFNLTLRTLLDANSGVGSYNSTISSQGFSYFESPINCKTPCLHMIEMPVSDGFFWPPVGGFSYCGWIEIDRYSYQDDNSNLRQRSLKVTKPSAKVFSFKSIDTNSSIFEAVIHDGRLNLISPGRFDITFSNPMFEFGKIYHLAIVYQRQILQSDWVTLYINGTEAETVKVTVDRNMADLRVAAGMASTRQKFRLLFGGDGIPKSTDRRDDEWEETSALLRVGDVYVIDEALAPGFILAMYLIGNGQMLCLSTELSPLVPLDIYNEEVIRMYQKISKASMLGDRLYPPPIGALSPSSIKFMCSASALCYQNSIRSIFKHDGQNELTFAALPDSVECKLSDIVRLENNFHTRTVLTESVTEFHGLLLSDMIHHLGGLGVIFGILSEADDSDTLHQVLWLISSILQKNARNLKSMVNSDGYYVILFLLLRRSHLLDEISAQVFFEIVGINTECPATGFLSNPFALKDLILCRDLWREANPALQNQLYKLLSETICSKQSEFNFQRLALVGAFQSFLHVLLDDTKPISLEGVHSIIEMVAFLLRFHYRKEDLLCLARAILATLSDPASDDEPYLFRSSSMVHAVAAQEVPVNERRVETMSHNVYIRNLLLMTVLNEMKRKQSAGQELVSDEFNKIINLRFLMHILSHRVNIRTFILTLQLIMVHVTSKNKHAKVFKQKSCIQELEKYFEDHCKSPHVYYLLLNFLYGNSSMSAPDVIDKAVFEKLVVDVQSGTIAFPECLTLIECMLKKLSNFLSEASSEIQSWNNSCSVKLSDCEDQDSEKEYVDNTDLRGFLNTIFQIFQNLFKTCDALHNRILDGDFIDSFLVLALMTGKEDMVNDSSSPMITPVMETHSIDEENSDSHSIQSAHDRTSSHASEEEDFGAIEEVSVEEYEKLQADLGIAASMDNDRAVSLGGTAVAHGDPAGAPVATDRRATLGSAGTRRSLMFRRPFVSMETLSRIGDGLHLSTKHIPKGTGLDTSKFVVQNITPALCGRCVSFQNTREMSFVSVSLNSPREENLKQEDSGRGSLIPDGTIAKIPPPRASIESLNVLDWTMSTNALYFLCRAILDGIKVQLRGYTLLKKIFEGSLVPDVPQNVVAVFQTRTLLSILMFLSSEVNEAALEGNTKFAINLAKLCDFVVDRFYTGWMVAGEIKAIEFCILVVNLMQRHSIFWQLLKGSSSALWRLILYMIRYTDGKLLEDVLELTISKYQDIFNSAGYDSTTCTVLFLRLSQILRMENCDPKILKLCARLLGEMLSGQSPHTRNCIMHIIVFKPSIGIAQLFRTPEKPVDLYHNGFDCLCSKDSVSSFWKPRKAGELWEKFRAWALNPDNAKVIDKRISEASSQSLKEFEEKCSRLILEDTRKVRLKADERTMKFQKREQRQTRIDSFLTKRTEFFNIERKIMKEQIMVEFQKGLYRKRNAHMTWLQIRSWLQSPVGAWHSPARVEESNELVIDCFEDQQHARRRMVPLRKTKATVDYQQSSMKWLNAEVTKTDDDEKLNLQLFPGAKITKWSRRDLSADVADVEDINSEESSSESEIEELQERTSQPAAGANTSTTTIISSSRKLQGTIQIEEEEEVKSNRSESESAEEGEESVRTSHHVRAVSMQNFATNYSASSTQEVTEDADVGTGRKSLDLSKPETRTSNNFFLSMFSPKKKKGDQTTELPKEPVETGADAEVKAPTTITQKEAIHTEGNNTDDPVDIFSDDDALSLSEEMESIEETVVQSDLSSAQLLNLNKSELRFLAFLDPEDAIVHVQKASKVDGLERFDGHLILCQNGLISADRRIRSLYFVDDAAFDGIQNTTNDELLEAKAAPGGQNIRFVNVNQVGVGVYKWTDKQVGRIMKRLWLQQPVALEILDVRGSSMLFVLPDVQSRNEITNFLTSSSNLAVEAKSLLVTGASSPTCSWSVESKKSLAEARKLLVKKWCSGAISNFEYLMELNFLAGRTMNDISRYPVFPWVLADYTSESLDLSDPRVFRDLSKPMGCQDAERQKSFEMRYEEWDQEDNNVPPFHYGTHYSTSAHILHYLVRIQPFTGYHLALQGGGFDVPDRLFHCLAETWEDTAGNKNMIDVKELCPEFFYLPDFLVNNNNLQLGSRQDGQVVGNVILPPWAKGDPLEFIKLQRAALESSYVSAHLHEWVDLIFGFKQRGKFAVDAVNVFYYLTYEGAIDVAQIKDDCQRQAVVAQISHFGQSPKQLFQRPHPPKQVLEPPFSAMLNPELLEASKVDLNSCWKNEDHGFIAFHPVTEQCFMPSLAFPGSLNICLYDSKKVLAVLFNLHDGFVTSIAFTSDGMVMATGGQDGCVRLWDISQDSWWSLPMKELDKKRQGCSAHLSAVSCLVLSRNHGIAVSGGQDGSVFLWDLSRSTFLRSLPNPARDSVVCACIDEEDGNVYVGSESLLEAWTVNGEKLASGRRKELQGFTVRITSCASRTDSLWLPESSVVTGHADGSIRFWNLKLASPSSETGKERYSWIPCWALNAGNCSIVALSFSSGCKELYSRDEEGRTRMWRVNENAAITRGVPEVLEQGVIIAAFDEGLAVACGKKRSGRKRELSRQAALELLRCAESVGREEKERRRQGGGRGIFLALERLGYLNRARTVLSELPSASQELQEWQELVSHFSGSFSDFWAAVERHMSARRSELAATWLRDEVQLIGKSLLHEQT